MPIPPRASAELDFPVNVQLHPSPADWRDQFIYFLLVDRFDNNDPSVPAFTPASAGQGRKFEERSLFQGGNLKGDYAAIGLHPKLGLQHGVAQSDFEKSSGLD